MNLNSMDSNIIPKFNYRDLIILIVPILIFSLYFFIYYPGVLTVSSYGQLHQIAAGRFTTANPILHTFLVMLSLKFSGNLTLISILQILVFSVMWMIICKYHRDDSSTNSNEFVLQFIITMIICLIPINAIYSITLSSNILFSYSIMFLCFLIKVMIDKNGKNDLKFHILLAITLGIISGMNNYGIVIAVFSFIAILYYLVRKNTSQEKLVNLIGITLFCILMIGSLNLIYDVKGSGYDGYTQAMNIPTDDAFDDEINIENAKNEFFSSTNLEQKESYENVESTNAGNYKFDLIDSYVNQFRNNFLLGGLFDNPIVYIGLSIILLFLIYFLAPSKEMFLLYVPPFLNVIINFVTGQNNLYSTLLVFYLLVIIFISIWFKSNLNHQNNLNLNTQITKQKQIETQKSLKPKQNYVKNQPTSKPVQNYNNNTPHSNLESEIEDLTLADINEILGQSSTDENKESTNTYDSADDLIDQILKEIEMGKK